MVLGFSFTGSSIPAGSGVLTTLTVTGGEPCLSDLVLSGVGGTTLDGEIVDCLTILNDVPCDDVDADGVCDDVDDCVGVYDECGVCNGDDSTCSGCTDVFGLNYDATATLDNDSCEYADHQVEAGMFYYSPSDLQVEPGESVQWNNVAGFHDVVSISGPESFSLPAVSGPALIGSITFNTVGVYEYICSIGNHADQGMVGTITVGDGCTSGVYDCCLLYTSDAADE